MQARTHDLYRAKPLPVPQIGYPEPEPKSGRLRVFAFVDRYPPWQNAGAEWMLHHMLRFLVERGHDVKVATVVPGTVQGDPPYWFDGVEVWPDTVAEDIAEGCDVMVGHLLFTRLAVELASQFERPLVYLFHNDFTIDHWTLLTSNVTMSVYNSQWLRASNWSKHGTWADHPSLVVRPPVLTRDYRLDRDPAGAEFVTLVNPNPDKGGHLLYELAARNQQRRFLAVEGAYGTQLRPRGRAGVYGNVAWQKQTGAMRDDVYDRTRVLLVPSRYESWGRVAVEALCSGIPVICSRTPGLLEALDDAGLYAGWQNVAGFHDHLARLDDPGFYAERSEMARARSLVLEAQTVADLDRWEQGIRLAAAASGVASRHDRYERTARAGVGR